MPENAPSHRDDNRLTRVEEMLAGGTLKQAARLLNALQPAEIAHLLESLPRAGREILWELVEDKDGEVLIHLPEDIQADLLSKMDLADILSATEALDLDDLADLIQQLPDTVTRELLESLDLQRRNRLEAVLGYAEDTAGGLMNTDTVTVRPEVTLDAALRYLRRLGERVPDNTDALIVVNRDDRYLGMLSLARLVSADPAESVAEVMSVDVKPLPATWSAREVASRFERHDLVSAAVVDEDGKLVGRITVDDVLDVIREEGEHQFMGRAGLSEEEDMFAPVLSSAKRRTVWLGINLLTAFLASWVIGRFEDTISQMVALAVLMPIVASMGGIAGSQTLTLAIRGIALGQLTATNARWLVVKELAVGAINGVIWAVVVGVVAGVWFQSVDLAWLIAAAITINLIFAAFTGALLPLFLQRIGIDPALAGGVLLTTVTDVVGFLAFLGLATLFLL